MTTTPDDMLDAFEQRVQKQTEQAEHLSRRMQEITSTTVSTHGDVRVTVDSTGGLSSLHLSSATVQMSRPDLANLILQTSQRAQTKLAEIVAELVTEVYGPDSTTASFVADTYAERFSRPNRDDGDESQ